MNKDVTYARNTESECKWPEFVKSSRLWDLINIISTYLDSWSNESNRRTLPAAGSYIQPWADCQCSNQRNSKDRNAPITAVKHRPMNHSRAFYSIRLLISTWPHCLKKASRLYSWNITICNIRLYRETNDKFSPYGYLPQWITSFFFKKNKNSIYWWNTYHHPSLQDPLDCPQNLYTRGQLFWHAPRVEGVFDPRLLHIDCIG